MVSWNWDESASESGVVHESVTNTDHENASILKQGYNIANPYLSADLAGYWPLHEDSGSTAYDFSGNNNDGTINGATVNQTGLLGTSAYSFDGTDDVVQDTLSVPASPSGYTVSCWINGPALNSEDQSIVTADDSNNHQFVLGTSNINGNNTFRFYTYDGTLYGFTTGNTDAYDANVWTHLAAVYDSSSGYTLYKNTNSVGSSTDTGWGQSNDALDIGGEWDGNYFEGRIADVRVYNTALSTSEIQTLYDVVATQGAWESTTKTL